MFYVVLGCIVLGVIVFVLSLNEISGCFLDDINVVMLILW